jgi:uncharacterized membrane protein
MLLLILVIVAVVGVALHALLWHTIASYRSPLLFHLSVLVGFIALLVLVLK